MSNTQTLIAKIQSLPPDRIGEVEDFVDFIAAREQQRAFTHAATTASAPSFCRSVGQSGRRRLR